MKKYTKAEFENFEIDEYGLRVCPSGDYTEIDSFGERCSFGEGCSFGEWCRFGERCRFGEVCRFGEGCSHEGLTNSTYFACDRIGSEKRKTYFFKSDDGFYVRAGCFFGTFDEFVKRVNEVHGGTKFEREYLAAVELAKLVLGKDE